MKAIFERWMIIPGFMVLIGLAGAVYKLIYGEHALGTSAAVPWGSLIAGYVFFAAAATGVGLIGSIGHFVPRSGLAAIERRSLFLAVSLLVPGFTLIGIELGNPFNMIYILFSPNFTSGIFWMGFLYSIYLALLFVECYFSQVNPAHGSLKWIGGVAVLNKITAVCNLGAIFALAVTRPYWVGVYFPVYMLVTAVLSGAAALFVVLWLMGKWRGNSVSNVVSEALSKVLMVSLVITALLNGWKVFSGLNSVDLALQKATALLVSGSLAWRYWGLEIGMGLLLPVVLVLLARGDRRKLFAAALLTLIGVFFMRVDFIQAGQVIPQVIVPGIQHITIHSYIPSLTEWALIFGATGASVLLYAISEKLFKLDAEKAETFTK